MIEAAGVARKVERKLRPIRKWIDSIANVMHEARAAEDGRPRLSAPDKRIEAPGEADCAAVWRAVGTAEAAKCCHFRRRYSVLARKPRRSPSGLPRRKALLSRTLPDPAIARFEARRLFYNDNSAPLRVER